MEPAALAEIALVTSRPIESAGARADARRAPWPKAAELRLRTSAPYVKRATREAQAAQATAAVEASLALCICAITALDAQYRRGVRSVHIARQLDAWGCWGPWLGRRSADGVAQFLRHNLDRPCAAGGPVSGWGVVRRDTPEGDRRRYAVRYLG